MKGTMCVIRLLFLFAREVLLVKKNLFVSNVTLRYDGVVVVKSTAAIFDMTWDTSSDH